MIKFIIGVFVGTFFGMFVMSLCKIAGDADRREEQYEITTLNRQGQAYVRLERNQDRSFRCGECGSCDRNDPYHPEHNHDAAGDPARTYFPE